MIQLIIDNIEIVIQLITAIATFSAAVVAFWGIRCTNGQFQKTQEELRNEASLKYANGIAAWFEDKGLSATRNVGTLNVVYRDIVIRNEGCLPIYDVVVTVVGRYGAGPNRNGDDYEGSTPYRVVLLDVPPGIWCCPIATGGGGMGVQYGLEISFVDAHGRAWIRRGNGLIEDIDENPLIHYSIPRPCSWSGISRIE